MPRQPRLFIPGATYHVYCRVARGEFVFDDAGESEGFVEAVRQVRNLHGWRVLAWCLMGNHYHLVVSTGTIPLWRSMLHLQAQVAREFNRRHGYLGRLWQSRYRARVIDSQTYFEKVVAYVHLNPVAAGIVEDPADYRLSGHRAILGIAQPRLVDLRLVLNGFGGRPWNRARQCYLEWLRAVAVTRWLSAGVERLPWWADARDVNEIVNPEQHPGATTHDGQVIENVRCCLDLEELLRRFELISEHTVADLASRRRSSQTIRGRIELTTLAVCRFGLRSCDVAAALEKDPTTVSRWLRKGLRLRIEDEAFRKRLDTLDRALSDPNFENAAMPRVAP